MLLSLLAKHGCGPITTCYALTLPRDASHHMGRWFYKPIYGAQRGASWSRRLIGWRKGLGLRLMQPNRDRNILGIQKTDSQLLLHKRTYKVSKHRSPKTPSSIISPKFAYLLQHASFYYISKSTRTEILSLDLEKSISVFRYIQEAPHRIFWGKRGQGFTSCRILTTPPAAAGTRPFSLFLAFYSAPARPNNSHWGHPSAKSKKLTFHIKKKILLLIDIIFSILRKGIWTIACSTFIHLPFQTAHSDEMRKPGLHAFLPCSVMRWGN